MRKGGELKEEKYMNAKWLIPINWESLSGYQ